MFAAAISTGLTVFFAWFGQRCGLVDRPSGRKCHDHPVSFLGGLAICGTVNIVLGFAGSSFLRDRLMVLVVADAMFLLGFADDVRPLSPITRLIFQGILAVAAVGIGVRIRFLSQPGGMISLGWIGVPLTVFWLMAMTNAMNFIDGLDGLAGGVSLIAGLSLMVIGFGFSQWGAVLLCAVLSGGLCGFLPFNLSPAKIFLGNGGAYFLGFWLGASSTLGAMKSTAVMVMVAPVVALGIPLLDTVWAMLRRIIGRQSLTKPDRMHIHHLLLETGISERHAVYILHVISLGLAFIAIILVQVQWQVGGFLLGTVGTAGMLWLRWLYNLQLAAAQDVTSFEKGNVEKKVLND